MNAVNVIRARYYDRIPEIGTIIDSLIDSVGDDLDYTGTIVLDYFWENYTNVCQLPRRCPEKRR
ncbi:MULTISPECIES: hypothetical protein [unclassified Bradyrhizobium]|uniref:hypothetical protein n=1 Tax=unclassified Bradyrhizobium TaxID=2631580 RepID=UPI001161280C|nr:MULTISPECIES: hypothetical protein [unclassified Bradyrhizobium]